MPRWISRIGARLWRWRRDLGWWLFRKVRRLPPLSTPLVTEAPETDPTSFRRSGFIPQPVAIRPYESRGTDFAADGILLDLDDPAIEVDESGVAVWRDGRGERQHHPVHSAQHALAALSAFKSTGDRRYVDRAIANARHLIDISERDEDGRMWLPYGFAHRYFDVTMPVPWWSAMAQGQALSLFTRLAEVQPRETSWAETAASLFSTFSVWRRLGGPWTVLIDEDGLLWFEEYVADVEPLKVVNGHIFATFGIYDYALYSGDPHATALFDGAATTALAVIDRVRVPGDVSYYCGRKGYCERPEWQNVCYHGVHIRQFAILAEITGDERFRDVSRQLEADVADGRSRVVSRLLNR